MPDGGFGVWGFRAWGFGPACHLPCLVPWFAYSCAPPPARPPLPPRPLPPPLSPFFPPRSAFEQKTKFRVPPVAFPECGIPGVEQPTTGRRMLGEDASAVPAAALISEVANADFTTRPSEADMDPEAGW